MSFSLHIQQWYTS